MIEPLKTLTYFYEFVKWCQKSSECYNLKDSGGLCAINSYNPFMVMNDCVLLASGRELEHEIVRLLEGHSCRRQLRYMRKHGDNTAERRIPG